MKAASSTKSAVVLAFAFAVTSNMCSNGTASPSRPSSAEQSPSGKQVTPSAPAPGLVPTRSAALRRDLPSLAPLVDSVKAAVVNVDTRTTVEGAGQSPDDLFDRFFGRRGGPQIDRQPRVMMGTGSGFIVRADGKVLTNHHVVLKATDIRVRLDDGREFPAKVLGSDPLTDLALLQLQGDVKDLPFEALGDSDAMKVGDWVVAIGNPFGLASSVSTGIVSAKERDIHAGPYDAFLQTDAAINPGNSGGPLFNLDGEVIGINTSIVGGSSGIGFAVPSNMAAALLPQLEKGEVRRGWLGVAIQDLTPSIARAMGVSVERGAVVSEIDPATPAGKAGLRRDDVIVKLDGKPVASARVLSRAVAAKTPGTSITLGVLRGDKQTDITIKLGTRPDLESQQEGQGLGQGEPKEQRERAAELGLAFESGENGGALITEVEPGSAADRGGLVPGMIVTEVAGKPVKSGRDLARLLSAAKEGSTLLVRVQVQGRPLLRAIEIPKQAPAG